MALKVKHWELVEEATKFLKENYEAELKIPIEFNTRLKKCLGRFMSNRIGGRNVPLSIEMSVEMMQYYPREHIIDVLKHELVHYILLVKDLPNSDGHPIFENELKKHGIKSTGFYKILGEVHAYECSTCKKTYTRKRKLGTYASCKCSSFPNLTYKGIVTLTPEMLVK